MLTANLRLLPLLLRRFEIADVMVLRPQIRVVRDGRREQLDAVVETIARTMQARRRQPGLVLRNPHPDGVLSYQDDMRGIVEKASRIEVSLAWPSISRSFAATGQFEWRGERVDGSDQHRRFRRGAVRRALRPEGAARQPRR